MSPKRLRILHVIDPRGGFQLNRCAAALNAGLRDVFEAQTCTLGPQMPAAFCNQAGGFQIIHAWGFSALVTAAIAARGPIVVTPNDEPTSRQFQWLRAVMKYRSVWILCTSAAQHHDLVRQRIAPERSCIVRPGVELQKIQPQRDAALRQALGFTDQDRVMLVLGASTRASAHTAALWAAAILHKLDPAYKVLARGRGDQAHALTKFAESQKQPALLTLAEQHLKREIEPEELLAAADILLGTPTGNATILPLAIGMASGLPIVGTATKITGEFLEDQRSALLAAAGSPRALARRVLDLQEDRQLGQTLGEEAQRKANQCFSLDRFIEQHRVIYQQLAEGEPARISDTIESQSVAI